MNQYQFSHTTVKRGRIKRWMIITGLVALFLGFVVYWAFFQREHSRWNEVVQLWNGESLPIRQHASQKAYHGLVGHFSPFWWGGGDPWHVTKFTWNGSRYRWEGPYIPIAIQPDDSVVYIAVFDRETPGPTRFRLYRSTTGTTFEEISTNEFPRHLAIENTWIRNNEILARLDPSDIDFRRSLTAKLWNYLENPGFFSMEVDPPEAFLSEYKTKWIKSASGQ